MRLHWGKFTGLLSVMFLVVLFVACGGEGSAPVDGDSNGSDGEENGEAAADVRTVKVGGLAAITGPTSETGASYAQGREDYFDYLESIGGIEGLEIEFIQEDYKYDIQEAQRIYQQLRDRDGVSAILGWGTGDTEALRQQVATDQIPFISASYSEELTNIDESPYNFFVAASYSNQGRMLLEWIKENHEGDDPTVALFYPDNGFGRSPIEDIKSYGDEIGVKVIDEQIVEADATEAQSQLLNMEKKDPDYAIIQNTWDPTAIIIRDAKTLGIDTQFLGLNQAVGEGLLEIAGDAAEGYMGALTGALPYEDVTGMVEYVEYIESDGRTIDDLDFYHVAGWVAAKVMVEGIKNAAEATDGEITGEDIRAGLESISNFDLGGLAAPVTFTADNHAGTDQIRLAIVESGKWEAMTDYFGRSD